MKTIFNILVLFLVGVVVNTSWASLIIPDGSGSFDDGIGGDGSVDGASDGSASAGGIVAGGASTGVEIIGDAGAEIAGDAGDEGDAGAISDGANADEAIAVGESGDAGAGGTISGGINVGGISAGGSKTIDISGGGISGSEDVGGSISDDANAGGAISGTASGDDAIDGSASAGGDISGDASSGGTLSGDDISAAAGSSRRISLSSNVIGDFSAHISNAFAASETTSGSFIESVKNLTATFVSESGTVNGTNVVLVNLQYFRSTLQAFVVNLQGQATGVTNSIKRQALSVIERQLQSVDVQAKQLRQRVNDVRRKLSNDVTREKLALQVRANIWTSKELANVTTASKNNATTIKDAETILNDYVSRHSSYLAGCADEADDQLLTSENQTQKVIDRYTTVVDTLMSQVESCLETVDTSSAGRQCANVAREPLLVLRRAPAEFRSLSAASVRLLSASYAGRACVVQTKAGFESEKAGIKRLLNKLVAASTSG